MKMPGFEAEESVDSEKNHYRTTGRSNSYISNHGVRPQAKIKMTFRIKHCEACKLSGIWDVITRKGKKTCHDETCDFVYDTDTLTFTKTCTEGPEYTEKCGWLEAEML